MASSDPNLYQNNICSSWKQLQVGREFSDVTLACDDIQIETHKHIISSFSPVLRNVLKKNPSQHPYIFLRGVKYDDLKNLVTYMYQGEIDISKQNLKSFLGLAKYLEIKGISGGKEELLNKKLLKNESYTEDTSETMVEGESSPCNNSQDHFKNQTSSKFVEQPLLEIKQEISKPLEIIEQPISNQHVKEKRKKISKTKISTHNVKCKLCNAIFMKESELEAHIETMLKSEIGRIVHAKFIPKIESSNIKKKSKRYLSLPNGGAPRAMCPTCGTEHATQWSLNTHIKKQHENAFSQPISCDLCQTSESGLPPQAKFWTQYSLDKHVKLCHNESKRAMCDKCSKGFNTGKQLKLHIEKDHMGIKYNCDECQNEFSVKKSLKRHVKLVHRREGKYPCKECGEIFNYQSRAIEHAYKDRGETRYQCKHCDFKSIYGWAFSKHKPICIEQN